ncbi:MAG: hypothetical protein ACFFCZ_16160 [Promethearchaeota archaeon]
MPIIERVVQIELPFTANVVCEIRHLGREGWWSLSFFKHDQTSYSAQLRNPQGKEDVMEVLITANIEFTSFSAIDTVTTQIWDIMENFEDHDPKDAAEVDKAAAETPYSSVMEGPSAEEELRSLLESDRPKVDDIAPELKEIKATAPKSKKARVTVGGSLDHTPAAFVYDFEMPYSNGTHAELGFDDNRKQWYIGFVKEGVLVKAAVLIPRKSEESIVDILSSANIDFQSFSAIYTIASDVLSIIKKPAKYGIDVTLEEASVSEEEVEEDRQKRILEEMKQEMSTAKSRALNEQLEEASEETGISNQVAEELSELQEITEEEFVEELQETVSEIPETETDENWLSLPATKIYEFELPYTRGARVSLYRRELKSGAYFWTAEFKLEEDQGYQDEIQVPNEEDGIVDILVAMEIEFQSFSAVYDISDKILDVMRHTDKYYQEVAEEEEEEVEASTGRVEVVEADFDIDLSTLREKEDIDRYIELLKTSMDREKPVLMRETGIKGVSGILCQIYRRGKDEWYLAFYSPTDEFVKTKPMVLPSLEVDHVAKHINQGVPQISFTALYDAAEELLKVINKLKERPEDELVINQAVNHFSNVIKDHEANGNLNKAMDIAQALLDKFRQFNNPSGIMEFGLKVAGYYEAQSKTRDGAKLRLKILEELIATKDIPLAKEYVEKCIAKFQSDKNNMDVARFSFRLADLLLSDEERNVEEGLNYVEKGIQIYEQANLPLALSENAIKYGHLLLKAAKGEDAPVVSEELLESVYTRSLNYFQIALQIYEERDDQEELLELMENVVTWLATYECPEDRIVEFSQRAIKYYEKAGEYQKILDLCLNLATKLMTLETHNRALEFFGKAVQIYYNQQNYEEVAKLGLTIIDRLLDIAQEPLALQYIDFVNQLTDSAFKDDLEKAIEYKVKCAERLTKIENAEERAVEQVRQAVQKAIEAKKPEQALELTRSYTGQLIEGKKLKLAQQLVNHLIVIIGDAGYVPTAAQVAKMFGDLTFEKAFYDLSTEYIKYASSLYQTAEDTDNALQLLLDNYPKFIEAQRIQNAEALITLTLEYFWNEKIFEDGANHIKNFLEKMVENGIYDRVYAYSVQENRFRQANEDLDKAEEALLRYRDTLVKQERLAEATELTNLAVQSILGRSQDYKRAIAALEPHVEQLVKAKKYEDAYVYAIQTVKYYEELEALEDATKFLKAYRTMMMDLNVLEDSEKITKLMIHRLGESGNNEEAIAVAEEFSSSLVELGQFELAAKYAVIATQLHEEIGQINEGIALLDNIIPVLLKEKPKELPNIIARKSRMYHTLGDIEGTIGAYTDASKAILEAKKTDIANPLALYVIDYVNSWNKPRALEIARDYTTKLNEKGFLGENLSFLEKTIDLMIEAGEEVGADTFANEYVENFLDKDDLVSAKETVEKLIQLANNDMDQIAKLASRFVRQLVKREHLGIAREYVDRVVSSSAPKDVPEPTPEGLMIAAQITEDYFTQIKDRSPELGREYAFRAGTYYEKVYNWAGVVRVYKSLDEMSLDNRRAIKALKRALRHCAASGVKNQEAELRVLLTNRLILAKDSSVPTAIKETLELYDILQDPEVKMEALERFMNGFINTNQFDLAYEYLEYIYQLTQSLGQTRGFHTIFRKILEHYLREENEEKARGTRRILSMLPVELEAPTVEATLAETLQEGLQEATIEEDELETTVEATPSVETSKPVINLESAEPEAQEALKFKSELETALKQSIAELEEAAPETESVILKKMQEEMQEEYVPVTETTNQKIVSEPSEAVPTEQDLSSELFSLITDEAEKEEVQLEIPASEVPAPQEEERDDFSDLLQAAEAFMSEAQASVDKREKPTTEEMPLPPTEGMVETPSEDIEEDPLLAAVKELAASTEFSSQQEPTPPKKERRRRGRRKKTAEELEKTLEIPDLPEIPPELEQSVETMIEKTLDKKKDTLLEGDLKSLLSESTPEQEPKEGGLFGAIGSLLEKIDQTVEQPIEEQTSGKEQISSEKDSELDISNVIGEALDAVDVQFSKTEENTSPIAIAESEKIEASEAKDLLTQALEEPQPDLLEEKSTPKEEEEQPPEQETPPVLDTDDHFSSALNELDDILGGEGMGYEEADKAMKEKARKKKKSR